MKIITPIWRVNQTNMKNINVNQQIKCQEAELLELIEYFKQSLYSKKSLGDSRGMK